MSVFVIKNKERKKKGNLIFKAAMFLKTVSNKFEIPNLYKE